MTSETVPGAELPITLEIAAFDLWAFMPALNARVAELSNNEELHDDGVSEVQRLIRLDSRMAHDIANAASELPTLPPVQTAEVARG